MIAPTIGLCVVLATSAGMVPPAVAPIWDACAACDETRMEVQERIATLRSGSGLIASRKAARALGKYDWRLYPEAAEALADALLVDPRPLVRQQAASSLARMKPCLPTVRMAVAQAAHEEPGLLARHAAKRALKAIDAAHAKEDVIVLPEEREILLPSAVEPEVLSPTTTVRPAPLPPTTISPFAPGAEYEVPAPAPVPPPSIHLEDARPLAPSWPDVDRYYPNPVPHHGEIQPDDAPEIPADFPPSAAWPADFTVPPAALDPRPNYARSLLGIQP